jgi:hypothetical protein
MFILIGEAYREIEADHNPLLKEARRRASETFDKSESSSNFKSRRPENKSSFDRDEDNSYYEGVNDWN